MTLAVIFNGQGAQYEGMGMDFIESFEPAQDVMACAEEASGDDLHALINDKFDLLSKTRYAQITTAAVSMAIFKSISSHLPAIDYMAGLSLGEYSALMAAGYIDMSDGFALIKERGQLMTDHCQLLAKEGGIAMEAVLKADIEDIQAVVDEVNADEVQVYIANLNSSTQTVIAGREEAIARFKELAKEKGIKKTMPLAVEGPFHTPFMAGVQDQFQDVLAKVTFKQGDLPVISNTTVAPHQLDELPDTLIRHLVEPVRWRNTIDYFVDQGVDKIIQIGPGKTLGNLLKREKNVPDYMVVDKVEDIEELEEFIGGQHG